MSIFNLKYIRELQINGKDIEDEEDDNFEVSGADKRKRAPRQQPQEKPEENTNSENEDDDDFTMDEEDIGEDDTQNEEDTSNTNEEEPADDQSDDDTGNDDDFTMDGSEGDDPDSGESGEEGSEEDTGDDPDAEGGGEDTGEQEAPTDDKQAAESEIYESLSDEQKRIRIMKLKLDYKDLYETMINSIEGINHIPITVDNAESIKRLNILLNRSKTILISYIGNNFDQNTYMENYTNYIKYLSIFRTASMVIEELTNHKNANNR